MVAQAYSLSTWEVEAGGSGVQGHLPPSEIRPCAG